VKIRNLNHKIHDHDNPFFLNPTQSGIATFFIPGKEDTTLVLSLLSLFRFLKEVRRQGAFQSSNHFFDSGKEFPMAPPITERYLQKAKALQYFKD